MSYPAPPPASPPPADSRETPSGFFNDLFDIRFTRFVALRLISVVYVLILVAVSITALAIIFAGFAQGAGYGFFTLIFAVLGWLIYVVLARVALEALAVLFRIHDDTSRTADAVSGGRGTVAGTIPPPRRRSPPRPRRTAASPTARRPTAVRRPTGASPTRRRPPRSRRRPRAAPRVTPRAGPARRGPDQRSTRSPVTKSMSSSTRPSRAGSRSA